MKFFVPLVIFFGVFSSCGSDVKEERYANGEVKEKYEVSERKDGSYYKNGFYKHFHRNGNVEITGNYKDGVEEGEWTEYYEGGNVKVKGVYADGKRIGVWKEFYENGQTVSEDNYINGQLDGTSTSWAINGSVENESVYENGKNTTLVGVWYYYNVEGGIKYADTIRFTKNGAYEILNSEPSSFLSTQPAGSYVARNKWEWEFGRYSIKFSSLTKDAFRFTVSTVTGNYVGERLE